MIWPKNYPKMPNIHPIIHMFLPVNFTKFHSPSFMDAPSLARVIIIFRLTGFFVHFCHMMIETSSSKLEKYTLRYMKIKAKEFCT